MVGLRDGRGRGREPYVIPRTAGSPQCGSERSGSLVSLRTVRPTGIRAGQRIAGLAVAGLAMAALLTGCSAEEQQASTDLPPAPSSSAEPTPELPPLGPADFPVPDEARVQDEAGAEAFLEYYVELINRQTAIPDGAPLRDLGPDCNECQRIAARLDEAASAQQAFRGGRISLTGDAGWAVSGAEARASFYVRVAPGAQMHRNGSAVAGTVSVLQKKLPSAAILRWSDARRTWLVSAVNFG